MRRPQGDSWHALDAVVDDGHLDAWLESLAAANGGQRDVAGAYLGSWLAGALVSVPMSALVLERRVPHLDAGLWVHRNDGGWIDRVAFASARRRGTNDTPPGPRPKNRSRQRGCSPGAPTSPPDPVPGQLVGGRGAIPGQGHLLPLLQEPGWAARPSISQGAPTVEAEAEVLANLWSERAIT